MEEIYFEIGPITGDIYNHVIQTPETVVKNDDGTKAIVSCIGEPTHPALKNQMTASEMRNKIQMDVKYMKLRPEQ